MEKEQHIIESWHANAGAWINLIESNGIESRKLVTNKAIVDAILAANPASVFDIGCGEGWLVHELAAKGIQVAGADIIPEFIAKVKQKVNGRFFVASYEEIYSFTFKMQLAKLFDAIVINFALIGKESTENLLASLPQYLLPGGRIFIQTLHPHARREINDYVTGWKEGSWDGLGDNFTQPYHWYFRTIEDWLKLLNQSGFSMYHLRETLHPVSGKPLSVIFEAAAR